MNKIIPVGALSLALLLSGAISFSSALGQESYSAAPSFRVTDLKGKTISFPTIKAKCFS